MDLKQAVDVLCRLRDGVHPESGDPLPAEDVSQQPAVLRALFTALAEIEQRVRRDASRPARFGQPWSDADDRVLLDGFSAGAAIEALARDLERTRGSVRARLVLHGKLEPDGRTRFGLPAQAAAGSS